MKLSLIILGLLAQSILYACGGISQQVYSGKIEYSIDSANPLACVVTITMDFDVNESLRNDSIWVNWGDNQVQIVRGVSITKDTVASANTGGVDIYTHVYSGSHTYATLPSGGYYFVSFQNEYRINGVSNIASGDGINLPFYLVAQIGMDTNSSGEYKPLVFPPLAIGFTNFETYTQAGLVPDNESGDSLVYVFNTPLETVNNPVPEYQLPDQFCIANGSSADSFTMDAVNGNVVWNSPCLQGIYCFGTLLSKYRNGKLTGAIMREQNIYVLASYVNSVQTIKGSTTLTLYPNPGHQTLSGIINSDIKEGSEKCEIISPDGRVVSDNIVVKNGRFETDISQLSDGVYFLHLHGTTDATTLKFIKQ